MANENGVITQIIDSAAVNQQYKTLSSQLDALDDQFVKLTKDVIAFSQAAGNAKGMADFTKAAAAAQIASEKQIQAQNQTLIVATKLAQEQTKLNDLNAKAAITNNKLAASANQLAASNARVQNAQEKAAEATRKALSPYQQLSKELDKQRLAAKDLGLQYGLSSPEFKKAQEGVLKLDTQLKTLDKSLGQNQRNVGNYEHDVKSALESLYGSIDKAIPGAGALTRTVVEGFGKITSEAKKAGSTIVSAFTPTAFKTPGGFGFKPESSEGSDIQTISNTEATVANTEAVVANTEANKANAASEAERAAATAVTTDATKEQAAQTSTSTGLLGVLGEGFATFSTVAFVAAIAAASYYLSQFKSTGNEIDKFMGGLKAQFANFGQNIVEGLKNFSGKSLLNAIPFVAAYNAGKGFKNSFNKGVDDTADTIALVNATELDEATNAALSAEAEKFRAMSKDRKVDIAQRQEYIKQAQSLERKVLENQKDNAQETINTAIRVGDKAGKLTFDQAKDLEKGDLDLAQRLAQNGQVFTSEGYELYKHGVEKRIAYQQGANNQLVKLQADADNMQLRADNGLAKAQLRIDKARVNSALESSKLILDDADASGKAKLKANEEYVKNSIRLIEVERKNALESAGLGSSKGGADSRTEAKNRIAIEIETQNEINKVKAQGLKQEDTIQKAINAAVTKDYADRLKLNIAAEDIQIDTVKEKGNDRLLAIETQYSKEAALLAKLYRDGVISATEYNDKISQLQKDTALQKVKSQIETQKSVILTQAEGIPGGTTSAKDIQHSADELVKLQNQASDLATQNEIDNVHKVEDAKKQLADTEEKIALASIDLIKTVIDGGYQKELDALKMKADQLAFNETIERNNIQNSLLSSKQKAAQERILAAQVASEKKAIAAEEAKIKQKIAVSDKAASAANIIEGTAVAVVNALKLPPPYGEAVAVAIGVLGALQLAKVIATPIPKYATGTTNHPGGLGIVGDAGYEFVKYPDGRSFLSGNKATVVDMPKGTTVVPHLETAKQLGNLNYTGGQSLSMEEVAKLLKENNRYQKKIAEKPVFNGYGNIVNDLVTAQRISDRRNNYFK